MSRVVSHVASYVLAQFCIDLAEFNGAIIRLQTSRRSFDFKSRLGKSSPTQV